MGARKTDRLERSARLWFEHLQLALRSDRPDVQKALKKSTERYAAWGDIRNVRFDDWWPERRKLFEHRLVRVITDSREFPEFDESEGITNPLYLEVHMNSSFGAIVDEVREALQAAYGDHPVYQKKAKNQGEYALVGEPKLEPFERRLSIYRDIY